MNIKTFRKILPYLIEAIIFPLMVSSCNSMGKEEPIMPVPQPSDYWADKHRLYLYIQDKNGESLISEDAGFITKGNPLKIVFRGVRKIEGEQDKVIYEKEDILYDERPPYDFKEGFTGVEYEGISPIAWRRDDLLCIEFFWGVGVQHTCTLYWPNGDVDKIHYIMEIDPFHKKDSSYSEYLVYSNYQKQNGTIIELKNTKEDQQDFINFWDAPIPIVKLDFP